MQIKIKKLSENAKIPFRGSKYAAGYDLFAAEDAVIYAGQRKLIKTDIAIELPPNTYGQIAPRSGLALKEGIMTMAGVVDSDFRGAISVILFNSNFGDYSEYGLAVDKTHALLGRNPFKIEKGQRIAQLLVKKIEDVEFIEVQELNDSARAESGFGASGK